MPLSSELKSPNKKHIQNDYTHHSDRRERFREETRRDLMTRIEPREEFGRRENFVPPKKPWFSSMKLRRT